jgi:type II secretory pathway component PulF
MADGERRFDYVAVDAGGRRVKGSVAAADDGGAFERLKREGLSPLRIRAAGGRVSRDAKDAAGARRARQLTDRETAEFLSDLSVLLQAGANMRAALGVLGARSGSPAIGTLARNLTAQISGGGALDQAFSGNLGRNHAFIGALVAAGEAAGGLAGGLKRAAEMLDAKTRLKDQLVSVLSYPTFVFASTVAALGVILLFVVPSLAPLVEDAGGKPPLALALMIGASNILRTNLLSFSIAGGASLIGFTIAGALGMLTGPIERLLLDGPMKRITAGLVFGSFAIALGNMLTAGAPMSEALRLAIRSVKSGTARSRLEPVAQAVRQGQSLSGSLGQVKHVPDAIVRLAGVGEASGALGVMLARAGKLEEDSALRRIEAAGRLLGPALIVILGALIGIMMAGLLSGVSQLGGAALQ